MIWMSTETIADPTTPTVEVTMPATDSQAAVTVAAWLKHPGEPVGEQEAICVVDVGGAKAEIGSPAAGLLRMVTVAAGQHVAVGATLAVVDVAVARPAGLHLDELRA
jgi:pyruvate/2-oxoglutarate dehydrogenase complex dihydrolipoamide acyltransferase (E2) component